MGEETKPEEQAPAASAPAPPETKTEEKLAEANKEAPPPLAVAEDVKPPTEEEKKEEAPPQPPPTCVLYVDLHCVGCSKKIERSIMKIKGVEGVIIEMAKNQVTIKGAVEPQVICNKIMQKTKRKAKVLSATLPATQSEPIPAVVTSQVSELNTVELNVNMHCEACAEQLKKKILKMNGVQAAETDLSSKKITVTGTMDANNLVEYVYRRTKKTAKIVPQPEPDKPAEEPKPVEEPKPEENDASENKPSAEGEVFSEVINHEESMKRMMYQYNYYHYQHPMYVIERIPPPHLFSDENPNACCIS